MLTRIGEGDQCINDFWPLPTYTAGHPLPPPREMRIPPRSSATAVDDDSFDSGPFSYPALDVRSTRSWEAVVIVVEAHDVILLRRR